MEVNFHALYAVKIGNFCPFFGCVCVHGGDMYAEREDTGKGGKIPALFFFFLSFKEGGKKYYPQQQRITQ